MKSHLKHIQDFAVSNHGDVNPDGGPPRIESDKQVRHSQRACLHCPLDGLRRAQRQVRVSVNRLSRCRILEGVRQRSSEWTGRVHQLLARLVKQYEPRLLPVRQSASAELVKAP